MEESSAHALAGRFAPSNAQVRIRHIDEDEYQVINFNEVGAKHSLTPAPAPVVATPHFNGEDSISLSQSSDNSSHSNCTESMYLEIGIQENGAKPHGTWAVADTDAGIPSDGIMPFQQYQCLPNKKSRTYRTVETNQISFARMLERQYIESKSHPVANIESTGVRISRYAHKSTTHVLPLAFRGGISINTFNSVFNPKRQNKADSKLKHSYVIHSSFDRSDEIEAFQVWLYLATPTCSEDDYQLVRDDVAKKLENAGHANIGLLETVENYYAPVVNKNHVESAVFKSFNLEKSRMVNRYGVDVQSLKK